MGGSILGGGGGAGGPDPLENHKFYGFLYKYIPPSPENVGPL